MIGNAQTMPRPAVDDRPFPETVEFMLMRKERKLIALGLSLAGAMSILVAGCGKTEEAAPATPASTSSSTSTPAADTASVPAAAGTTIGTEIDDTAITARVKAALLADEDIKSFDINVESRKGVVQLGGFVDNQAQIDRAMETSRRVEGVASIDNNIAIKVGQTTLGTSVDDDVITSKIKAALLADDNVKSFDIGVETRKGSVQLSGFVDNQAQIDQALTIARAVEGVNDVADGMSVKK